MKASRLTLCETVSFSGVCNQPFQRPLIPALSTFCKYFQVSAFFCRNFTYFSQTKLTNAEKGKAGLYTAPGQPAQ